MLEANKQGRKHSTPSTACLAMLWASLGAEQQAALAAVLVRHSRSACAGRCLGLTGENTPHTLCPEALALQQVPPCQPGDPPRHASTQHIPLPPLGCRHTSAPAAAGRTPTSPCLALGIAPALPLLAQGRGPSSPATCVPCGVEEEGSAWCDARAGCVRASAGHRLCLGECVGVCLCGCILLMWAVWPCPMAHRWREGGREDDWKVTVGAFNGGYKEKNQLDLLSWLKFLFWAWTGYLITFLILLWDQRSVCHLSAWPCNCILSFTRQDRGVSVPCAGSVPVPPLGRLLRVMQLRSQQEMTCPQALPLCKGAEAGFPVINVLHN